MRVVVATKCVPDTAAKVEATAKGGVGWGAEKLVMNPWDEYAITEAILLKETKGVSTTALAIGPEEDEEALRLALAIGIDEAYRIQEMSLDSYDSLSYSTLLAAALRKLDAPDLLIFGKEFADTGSDAHIFQTARKLGWPVFSGVTRIVAVDFEKQTIRLWRALEEGIQTIEAALPCVLSVLKGINEPRYPTSIDIHKASKAQIPVWTGADLDIDAAELKKQSAKVNLHGYTNPPPRASSPVLIEGENDAQKADNLIARLIEDKIL